MMREAELEEMEQKWREENERILREHPFAEPLVEPDALQAPAELPPPDSPGPEPEEGKPSAPAAGPLP